MGSTNRSIKLSSPNNHLTWSQWWLKWQHLKLIMDVIYKWLESWGDLCLLCSYCMYAGMHFHSSRQTLSWAINVNVIFVIHVTTSIWELVWIFEKRHYLRVHFEQMSSQRYSLTWGEEVSFGFLISSLSKHDFFIELSVQFFVSPFKMHWIKVTVK